MTLFCTVFALLAPAMPCLSLYYSTRLVSLVAHKLLLDVTHDAMQYHRIRAPATAMSATLTQDATTSSSSSTRAVLTMEDLAASLKEYGVNSCRPEYMSDVPEDPAL